MLKDKAGLWILYCILAAVMITSVILAAGAGRARKGTLESASTEWHPPEHYQFVSISERLYQRYPAEKARRNICMLEKVTGLDCDQNPLVSVYVRKTAEKTYFYVSEIVVPEAKDEQPYLSLMNRKIVIGNASLDSIWEACKGGE